jgi:hypothetical protein
MAGINLLGVHHFYHRHNTDHLAILQQLSENWTSDTVAYVTPYYEVYSYRYYCQRFPQYQPICDDISPENDIRGPFEGIPKPIQFSEYLSADPSHHHRAGANGDRP